MRTECEEILLVKAYDYSRAFSPWHHEYESPFFRKSLRLVQSLSNQEDSMSAVSISTTLTLCKARIGNTPGSFFGAQFTTLQIATLVASKALEEDKSRVFLLLPVITQNAFATNSFPFSIICQVIMTNQQSQVGRQSQSSFSQALTG